MSTTDAQVAYLDHDNTIEMVLKSDGLAVDLTPVSRMVLSSAGQVIADSDLNAGVFDWSAGSGNLVIALGGLSLPLHREYKNSRLVVYDPTNINGIVWADDVLIKIK